MKKSVLLTSGLIWAGLIGTTFTVQAEQSLDEILAEYVEAKGGMEVIQSTKTMKAVGKMTSGPMEFPFAFTYKEPNKVYTTFEVQGMKGIQAYDGEKGWQVMPFMGKPEAVLMSEDELKQVKDQGDIEGPLINAEAKGIQLELIGPTEIEGTAVVEIKATKKNGDVIHLFLDQEYKLEVMTRAKMDMMGQQIEAETYFSDYKEVGEFSVPIAHSMNVKINGANMQSMNFDTVEFNMEVDDAMFEMPAVAEKKEAAEATE
jgi:outer membrane lipoprotein-sorting protein